LNWKVVSHELIYAGRRVRLVVAQTSASAATGTGIAPVAEDGKPLAAWRAALRHDFNQPADGHQGHKELLLGALSPTDSIAAKIEQIDRSADRAQQRSTANCRLQPFGKSSSRKYINLNPLSKRWGKPWPA